MTCIFANLLDGPYDSLQAKIIRGRGGTCNRLLWIESAMPVSAMVRHSLLLLTSVPSARYILDQVRLTKMLILTDGAPVR
jgi:hypothetical protein